jgi:uncharacterized membrane protein YbhN (UPF0104 family)
LLNKRHNQLKNNTNWKIILSWTVGISLLVFFIVWFSVDYSWSSLFTLWQKLNFADIIALILLMLVSYLLRSMRIYSFFSGASKPDFRPYFRITVLHNFFNIILPMRSGAVTFPILLKRYLNIDPVRSASLIIWLLFLDLQLLMLFVIFFFLYGTMDLLLIIGLLFLLLFVPYLIFRLRATFTAAKFISQNRLLSRLISGIPDTNTQYWRIWFWTALNWPLKLTAYGLLLSRLILIPFYDGIWASLAGELGSIIPVQGLAGVGTYEAGVIFGLTRQGHGMESALKGSISLHLFILLSALLSVMVAFLLNFRLMNKKPALPRIGDEYPLSQEQ